jgi:lysozyme family protein
MPFITAFTQVVMVEGGYSNDPRDAGGKTRWGVTEVVARANGYTGDMAALPLDTARTIYKTQYWDMLRLDQIDALSTAIAAALFDVGVNSGVGTASRFLKRALNVLNRGGTDWPDIPTDDPIGPRTLYALGRLKAVRGADGLTELLEMIKAQRRVFYIVIAESNRTQESFEYGWQRRVG